MHVQYHSAHKQTEKIVQSPVDIDVILENRQKNIPKIPLLELPSLQEDTIQDAAIDTKQMVENIPSL